MHFFEILNAFIKFAQIPNYEKVKNQAPPIIFFSNLKKLLNNLNKCIFESFESKKKSWYLYSCNYFTKINWLRSDILNKYDLEWYFALYCNVIYDYYSIFNIFIEHEFVQETWMKTFVLFHYQCYIFFIIKFIESYFIKALDEVWIILLNLFKKNMLLFMDDKKYEVLFIHLIILSNYLVNDFLLYQCNKVYSKN